MEFREVISRLDYCADRLQDTVIENEDALKVCKRYDSPGTFVYLDPPYLNVKNLHAMKQAYQGNDGTELHEHLLDWCIHAKSKIMISNYPNDLYDKALKDWNREEITLKVMAGGGRGKTHKAVTAIEVIWTSPNVPQKKQMELFNG